MKIVCIDFETANSCAGSICAVGAVTIEDGEITDKLYTLVRPHPTCDFFSSFNTAIHGIRKGDVRSAPEFDEVYQGLLPLLDGAVLAAHNASFDVGVLRGALALYGIPNPELSYLCTVRLSRKLWPELPNHKLNTVCDYIDFTFSHHHAGEDAEACANILLAGMRRYRTLCPEALAEAAGISMGRIYSEGYRPCTSAAPKRR